VTLGMDLRLDLGWCGSRCRRPRISRYLARRVTKIRTDCSTVEAVYLTAAQVAELVHVDAKTVLRWSLEDSTMPVLRRGRVVRFNRERLAAWLERQESHGRRMSGARGRLKLPRSGQLADSSDQRT
jgi:excisionase family DNA binding protein